MVKKTGRELRGRSRPLIVGHRANTLSKLSRYISQGVDAVEIDLYESLVNHGPESIKPATLREAVIKWLASIGNHRENQTVEDFLVVLGKRRIPLVLDIKSPRLPERLVHLIAEEARRGLIVTSKYHPLLSELAPKLERATILASVQCRPADPVALARAAGARGLSVEVGFVDGELVNELHRSGMLVAVWTVNDVDQAVEVTELGVDILLKGTKVDGVYSADPVKDSRAELFRHLTYEEVLRSGLQVMDLTAITLCKERRLPIRVFNMTVPGNLAKVLRGEPRGLLELGERLGVLAAEEEEAAEQVVAREEVLAVGGARP